MRRSLEKLSENQVSFICDECSITRDDLFSLGNDELYESVYEVMCDIEIDGIGCAEDGSDTERCLIASDIVTVMGNALREADIERYGDPAGFG